MGSRKHISRKDISASAFTPKPKPNILQTRPFSNGKHARSSELPTTKDILQTRPFATPAQKSSTAEKQPPTPESQEKASAFGYNGASIPSFAPSEAAPIQAKLTLGEPGDKYEQEADTVAAQVVDEINTPQSQQTAVGETVQREEMEEEEIRQKPEIETIQREDMLDENAEEKISPNLESATLQRDEMPQEEEEENKISPQLESDTLQREEEKERYGFGHDFQLQTNNEVLIAQETGNIFFDAGRGVWVVLSGLGTWVFSSLAEAYEKLRELRNSQSEPLAAINIKNLLGNTKPLAQHLARLLRLPQVGGVPPEEDPDPGNNNDKHWWKEIKTFLKNIQQAIKNASRAQVMRDLRGEYTDEQILDIEKRLKEAAQKMGEDIPPFPPVK